MSRERGARLFHVTLETGEGGRWGNRRGGNTRAEEEEGRRVRGKKKALVNTGRKWYKIYPYFFKGFTPPSRSVRILDFVLMSFPVPPTSPFWPSAKAHTVQSQPLNTNVNAFGFCGLFTPAFCPSLATVAASPGGRRLSADAFEAPRARGTWQGRGVAFSRVLLRSREKLRDICLVRFPFSHSGPPPLPSPWTAHKLARVGCVLRKEISARMPAASASLKTREIYIHMNYLLTQRTKIRKRKNKREKSLCTFLTCDTYEEG